METDTIPLVLNIYEIIIDDTADLALIYGECSYCHGLFGVDWTYLDQVDNIVHCPMCCMEVDFGEEE